MNAKTQHTYDQVFQHPISHNLQWHDAKAMLKALGTVEDERNGNLKVTLGGNSAIFPGSSIGKVATVDQVMQIRHLLQDAIERDEKPTGPHLLVVMDHQQAAIYRTEVKNSVPEVVTPYNPAGHKGHVHSAHDFLSHTEEPDTEAYFKQVATSVIDAEKILLFGSSKGSSGTMDRFVDWLRTEHPYIAERVIGAITVDQGHLTEGQLLAKTRELYGLFRV